MIRRHVQLFVNISTVNPTFNSQGKEFFTSKVRRHTRCTLLLLKTQFFFNTYKVCFISYFFQIDDKVNGCVLDEQFLSQVAKQSGILEAVFKDFETRDEKKLIQAQGRKLEKIRGIPKLQDANLAGTNQGHLCTLILTEGDSAKSLAVAGLSVVGRDCYGVYPLRGKLLNVRDATADQVFIQFEF